MTHQIVFAFFLLVFTILVLGCNFVASLLRDISTADPKPYSFARVQMAWWSIIVLSAFAAITFSTLRLPVLDDATLVLLGIGLATTGIARTVDVSDIAAARTRAQDSDSQGPLLDILSDKDGASISRFQAIAFNVILGIWYVIKVFNGLGQDPIDQFLPKLEPNHLVLLGISSSGYLGVKMMENKS
jgi:hypothetical protein